VRARTRVVAAVVGVGAAVTALVIAVASPRASADWEGQLERCFSTVENGGVSADNVKCVEQVYSAATGRGEITDVIEILARIADMNEHPLRFAVCHHAAHRFGPTAVKELGGVRPAIEVLSTPVCGLIHGPYDIFGRESHTFDEWVEMVELCEDTKLRFGPAVQCSDALGHALSQSVMKHGTETAETLFSVRVCAEFKARGGRLDCGEALIMERYGPLDPTLEPEPAPPASTMIAACLRLSTGVVDAREGCASGVGWYLSEFEGDAVRAAITREGDSRRVAYGQVFDNVRSVCELAGEELGGFCMRRFFSLVDVRIMQDVDNATAFCRNDRSGPWQRDCFTGFRFRQSQELKEAIAERNADVVPDLAELPMMYPSEPIPSIEEFRSASADNAESVARPTR